MESQNTHFDNTLYSGVEEEFDPWFDPNCPHPTWLPFSPSIIWQQQQQSQQRINSFANTMAHNSMPMMTTTDPFQIAGLGFLSAMQPVYPMLSTQWNMNTNTFTHNNYGQGSMGMASDVSTTYGGTLRSLPVDSAINPLQAPFITSMSMAPLNLMSSAAMDLRSNLNSVPLQMADCQQDIANMSDPQNLTAASNVATVNSVTTGSSAEQLIGKFFDQIKQPALNTASPTSSAVISPPARRRKSPVGAKPAKSIVKKTPVHTTKKDATGERRVGRRRGPLGRDQREQVHEIRKLRACLRCKFLKKTCDKGDTCSGCQPSHARRWQVPCTRIDIKDIAYFMKDWKADYERHIGLGFSISNIKGFSPEERMIYVTHGYGHYLPLMAREVFIRDEKCFSVDWFETLNGLHFEINTAKLSVGMEGISRGILSDYLDRHIDGGFEQFVDEYFEGTYFVTELLKTAYRFYCRENLPVIRKALKLVLAYNLTLHVTMVQGLSEEENPLGKVENQQSKFCGKTVAPVMINFQVKCALADMWRELQKDVLKELSSLYQSVYGGDKLKYLPTIFMLVAILLVVWELIQFDCNYRVPDLSAVNKFCSEMEGTPVGVIVGLFLAISQKLPAFTEWDSRKHHQLLNSNTAVCDAMTEIRAHVTKYGKLICHLYELASG